MMIPSSHIFSKRTALAACMLLSVLATNMPAAHAACTAPAGAAGTVMYNADYATVQFCNGTQWISMAASGALTEVDPHVGTLTASNFCTSNAGGTQIVCTTAAIPISGISATGTASASTYLRGDGTWATISTGLPSLTSANIWVGNGSNAATAVTLSGDATMTNAGAVTVTKINGATLGTTTATSGNLLIGSGTQWAAQAVTGDVTITSGGVTAIGTGKVTNAMLAGSIAASKLVGTDITTVGTITTGVWNAGAVTSSGTITGNLFSGSGASLTSLNASNLASGTVPTARLGSGTADSTTYLRGDGSWSTPAGSSYTVQTFTSNGTWTKPSSGTTAYIECWGGGGGGARSASKMAFGGGGGGYGLRVLPISILGATETVTIGAGGAAATTNGSSGGNGGSSSFGAWLTATGGHGGYVSDESCNTWGGGNSYNGPAGGSTAVQSDNYFYFGSAINGQNGAGRVYNNGPSCDPDGFNCSYYNYCSSGNTATTGSQAAGGQDSSATGAVSSHRGGAGGEPGSNGSVPGGGGGGKVNGNSGAGGAGKCIVSVI